jgi:hypothetical protein
MPAADAAAASRLGLSRVKMIRNACTGPVLLYLSG